MPDINTPSIQFCLFMVFPLPSPFHIIPSGLWLAGSRGVTSAIGHDTAQVIFGVKRIRIFLSCFFFLPHPADSGMLRFSCALESYGKLRPKEDG